MIWSLISFICGFVAGWYLAKLHFEGKQPFKQAWDFIVNVFKSIWNWIKLQFKKMIKAISNKFDGDPNT